MTSKYTKQQPLADWLQDFANKELKRGTSPHESIQNIFNKNNDLDSVEAMVQELRERVGLDKLEKTAIIREVEKSKERGEGKVKRWCVYPKNGGKSLGCHPTRAKAEKQLRAIEWSKNQADDTEYCVKDEIFGGLGDYNPDKKFDKDQMEKGIKVELEHTNNPELAKEIVKDHLQESKDFKDQKGAKYYDLLDEMEDKIKDKLTKKQSKLYKLITIANELEKTGNLEAIMFVDRQINKLAQEIGEQSTEFAPTMMGPTMTVQHEDIIQSLKKQKNIIPDLKKQKDSEWYALIFNGHVLGVANNLNKLQIIKNFLSKGFADNGIMGVPKSFQIILNNSLTRPEDIKYYMSTIDDEDMPLSIRERESFKRNIPRYLEELKTDKKYANRRFFFLLSALLIDGLPKDYEPNPQAIVNDKITDNSINASKDLNVDLAGSDELMDAKEKFIESGLEGLTQNADFTLSCRDGQNVDDEKDIFDKYPNVKTHIDNVCESRGGHIDVPALNHKIFSGYENFTNSEKQEIKDYIEKTIKESKKNTDISSNDDNNIGKHEYNAFEIDDDNMKVFDMPSKV